MTDERSDTPPPEKPVHRKTPPATPAVQAKMYRKVQQQPKDGSTHWSVRKLAAEMGVSKSSGSSLRV